MRSRDTILDATRAVIGEAGFDGVNIAAVAKRAGVSRQTVYSIFGNREELVSQAVSGRLAALLGAYESVVESSGSLLELLVETTVGARRHILGDPLLRVLVLPGPAHPISDAGAAERSQRFASDLLIPAIGRFPELTGHVDFVADVVVHLGWSVLCLDDPAMRSDEDVRTFLTAVFTPLLESLVR